MTQYNDTQHLTSNEQISRVTVNNAPNDNPATLWLIDDDAALRLVLADTFEDAGLNVISFTQAQAAWTRLNDVLQHILKLRHGCSADFFYCKHRNVMIYWEAQR